ncbi:NADH-quinone oxidoreductase subunit NuoH [Limnoglobus roseus]|uniref:NADH-quinone oxidoreductase subunit H n=1 Tax=Limnoglobus roseus TaxID=2598579 RepID=A0A5C1AJD9_9BACT|nr:NADH-quinone oxidoreductase subunit NuoH [Limnoglobus roseus]QEL17018.1 NADH-quinone oxidoreductase subunit NuoH [Limnoglobus roseus]
MPTFNWIYTAIFIAVLVGAVLNTVAYLILAERKIAAWVQDRLGPNRVGPWGLLQPIVDGGKMFLKEDVIPAHVDKVFFLLAPMVAFGTAMLAIAVVPVGHTVPPPLPMVSVNPPAYNAPDTPVQRFEAMQKGYADQFSFAIAPGLDIGILYVFAVGSLAVYGVILAGWSANNKYALIGSLRSSAQIISYEIPLGMSILGVVLLAGSLNPERIVANQIDGGMWNVFYMPLAFLLFLTSVFAECNRLPFDLPESEQELVGGYHTEYSSLKLGMLLLAEYAHMITTSFLMSCLFFGGWHLPGLTTTNDSALYGPWGTAIIHAAVLAAKMFCFIALFMVVRWTIPRFRFDQLMSLAWKVMIPLALLNLVCVLLILQFGWPWWSMTVASVVLFVLAGAWGVWSGGNVTAPKRKVRKLPPGLPAGVV